MLTSLLVLAAASGAAAQETAGDLAPVPASEAGYGTEVPDAPPARLPPAAPAELPAPAPAAATAAAPAVATPAARETASSTYAEKDVIAAAEGAFGKGAEGLGKLIEKVFKDLGEPNAYVDGREISGALVVGVRYGSGTLHHRIEGDMPVYWTGPSVGFDIGGDGSKTFALVYHLDDSGDLFRRFPAVEGKVYFVGGFTANYLQRGKVIVVPIKLGVGWRLGANVGYLNFTRKSRILPF